MRAGEFRIGHGYDIHKLVEGRPLVLGGVSLSHPRGLAGHSDADVLLHAVMDAMLGASGLPDIGHHFPNQEERWQDASSIEMLLRVAAMVESAGWKVVNVDATLVAEAPRIGPHIPAMKRSMATAMGIEETRVNIKATTAEGMGVEGRGEAISAQAVALLARPV